MDLSSCLFMISHSKNINYVRFYMQGRLFALVGVETVSRHKYLVLRDSWGLQEVRSEGFPCLISVFRDINFCCDY